MWGNLSLHSFRELFFSLSKKPFHPSTLNNIGSKINHQPEETQLARAFPSRSVSKPPPDAEGAISDSTGVGTKSASALSQFPGPLHTPGARTLSETKMDLAAREREHQLPVLVADSRGVVKTEKCSQRGCPSSYNQ